MLFVESKQNADIFFAVSYRRIYMQHAYCIMLQCLKMLLVQ